MGFSGHFNALVTLSLCVVVQQATGMQVKVMMPKSTSFSTSSSEHQRAHHRLSAAGLQASPPSSPLSLSSSLSLSAVKSNKKSQTFSVLAQHKFDITSAQRDERKRPRDATGKFLASSSSHHRPIALLPLLRARRQHHGSSEKLTPDSETASSFELTIPLDVHLPSLVSHEKNIKKSPGRAPNYCIWKVCLPRSNRRKS